MKKLIVLMACILLFVAAPASAVMLTLSPSSLTVDVGGTFDVELAAVFDAGETLIGDFDIDILYDTTQASFIDYELGDYLGDIDSFEALDWSWGEYSPGAIDLYEVSFLTDSELVALQSGLNAVPLATLTFECMAAGTSYISIDGSDPFFTYKVGGAEASMLQVAIGDPVELTQEGETPVPEPATIILLGAGLAGLAGFRKKIKNR